MGWSTRAIRWESDGRKRLCRGSPTVRQRTAAQPRHGPLPSRPPAGPSRQVKIRQAAGDKEPIRVLRQPPVAHFGPSKDLRHHQEHMFDFLTLRLTQRPVPMRFGLDEALSLRGMLLNHLGARCTPHPPPALDATDEVDDAQAIATASEDRFSHW